MVQRIQTIMEHYQMKAAQFADAIGLQRSAVSHVLSGRNKPSLDFILRIKKRFPEIRLDWLAMGSGDMFEENGSPQKQSSDLFTSAQGAANGVEYGDSTGNFDDKGKLQQMEEEEMAPYFSKESFTAQVEQVMILYADGTFRTYRARKK